MITSAERSRSWRARHREQHLATAAAYRETHREKVRAASRKSKRKSSGMLDAPDELREGVCEICGVQTVLCLDHDHATGKVRGWLCNPCNRGLGFFKDNPEVLHCAAFYLEEKSK